MEDRHQQIKMYLQRADVQKRIRDEMLRARDEATVTISNAARLFGFTENQLRDWDEKGLLRPQRRAQDNEQDGKGPRRRQYTQVELSKLAIIHELMEKGDFSIGTIPAYVDEIWDEVEDRSGVLQERIESVSGRATEHLSIDQRVDRNEQEELWRYFVTQALRLSLLLICEDIPDTVAGIILPLEKTNVASIVLQPQNLPNAGRSLIGWLSQSRSFYTFLDSAPEFEHPSDFRIEPLVNLTDNFSSTRMPLENVLIVVQRKTKPLFLNSATLVTVERILGLIYQTIEQWQQSFERVVRDWMYQVTDFSVSSVIADEVLNGLANIIVESGGKTDRGQDRWYFSCILLPEDISLPVQQHALVVRAQSENAPHNLVDVSAKEPGLSLRAYLSGQIIYRANVSTEDFMIAHQDREASTRSAIAIPLANEDGMAVGVMYIASKEFDAFSEDDQRVLRLFGRMAEELLLTYHGRQLRPGKLTEMIDAPGVVDDSFREFSPESKFMSDVEKMLAHILVQDVSEIDPEEDVSFIAIDLDNQSSLALKYGNQVARNLSRAVGLRLQGQLRLFENMKHRRLYHVYSDRFYLFLRGISLTEARNKASLFKHALEGEYLIDARRTATEIPTIRANKLPLPSVTVRLGVISYKTSKLKQVLNRYPSETAMTQVTSLISEALDEVLERGKQAGGSRIISWDPVIWGYKDWE